MPARRNLQNVIESAIDFAIIVTDLAGIVTDWNAGAHSILGWSRDEMVGSPADRIFTPEDRAIDRAGTEMRLALADGRASNERWHLCKNGSRFWASGEMMPLRSEDGSHHGYVKILRDRTRQREAGQRLRESEDRYRTFLETVEAAFAIVEVKFDADDRPVDYRFLEANPAFERQTGVDLRGKWVTDFAPNLERFWFDTYGRVAKTGEPANFESRADDFGRWFDVTAVRIGDPVDRQVAIFFEDVTAKRELQTRNAAVQELSDRLRDLTEPGSIAAAVTEILGRTLAVSRVAYRTVGNDGTLVERDWTTPGVASLVGTTRFRDYGSDIEDLQRGETVIVSDTAVDPRTVGHTDALAKQGTHAFVNMPLFERGRLVALLHVAQDRARTWTDDEIMFLRDVAERVRAATERAIKETALRESEGRFRAFAETVPNHVWSSQSSGHLDWFNDQVYAYLGAERGQIDGDTTWGLVVHPDDVADAGAAWAHSLATGDHYETEFRIRRADGVYRWFLVRAQAVRDADGRIVRWVGTNTDIDEQRQAAAALAQLNASLEQQVETRTAEFTRVWNSTNDLMGTAGLDGFLKAVNPAWTRKLGWSEAELLDRPFIEIVRKEDHAETAALVVKLSQGIAMSDFVDHIATKDGSWRTVMWDAVPQGDVFHVVGRDITEQRRAEEQLRQSQKMEAVGQLTGGIAHDFNNLLTGITGSLDLMQSRISQGRLKDVDRYVTAAQGAAKRAAALTHRLLAFSRQQTLDPKPTDANRLVHGMEDIVRRSIGPQITLEVVTSGGLWLTMIDAPQLENALLNLCINARDAMPNGGRITVETANRWLDERAAAAQDLPAGQYISLCVTDTGTGMTPDVQAKAFDPFFTTKPLGQGTGLGLSMIYGFVRQSGGQVRIYSEIAKGTTMCLYLPRYLGADTVAETVPDFVSDTRATDGETVLIVDDEPTVRMLVTEVLEDLGYRSIEAADGPSGLRLLRSDARIDLLVTDVGLPGGMNGRQMADAARVTRPDLKILFITGYAENAVVGNGHLDHDMQVMTKPFVMDVLARRIRDMIEAR